jgi:hypothetical protein
MKNKKTKKTQIALISLIALAFLFLPKLPIQAASNDILVYSIGSYYSSFEIEKAELEAAGFNITTKHTDKITSSMLSDYGQIWIIDNCAKQGNKRLLGKDEITAIKEFQENGGGVLLSADDESGQKGVNPITKKFNNGKELFYSRHETGGDCVSPDFTWSGQNIIHPIWQGVTTVSSSNSDAKLSIKNTNIKVTAKLNNLYYGAVLDDGRGRVVFDTSFFRFVLHQCKENNEDTIYQVNVAKWLSGGKRIPSCEITASSTSINSGDSVILIWSSKNANSVVSSNNLNSTQELSGNITKKMTSATTYKLTVASSSGEQATCEITVNIKEPPKPLPVISGPCQNLVPCKDDCKLSDIFVMIQNIVNCLVFISVNICLLFIVIGGLLYIFSLGNPENLTKALGGLALVFLAWLIVNTVMYWMGVDNSFLMWSRIG